MVAPPSSTVPPSEPLGTPNAAAAGLVASAINRAESITLGDLRTFMAPRRLCAADYSDELLGRLFDFGAPPKSGGLIDVKTLDGLCRSSPDQASWRHVVRLGEDAAVKLLAAQPRPPSGPASSGRGTRSAPTSALPAKTSSLAEREMHLDESFKPPPAATSSPKRRRDDEFRDEFGRRRLVLPVTEHPPWSVHAPGGGGHDYFDTIVVDAEGTSIQELRRREQLVAEEFEQRLNSPRGIIFARRRPAAAASTRHRRRSPGGDAADATPSALPSPPATSRLTSSARSALSGGSAGSRGSAGGGGGPHALLVQMDKMGDAKRFVTALYNIRRQTKEEANRDVLSADEASRRHRVELAAAMKSPARHLRASVAPGTSAIVKREIAEALRILDELDTAH